MPIKLHKPIVFFDLETTGISVGRDRIVEISMIKVYPDMHEESNTWRVNPEMPIPSEVSEIHGIYDADVKDEPTFKEIAHQIVEKIKDADLAGFNSNRFDVPLLAEELLRCGMDFNVSKHRLVDVQVIFHKMEPRNLSAAYKFYCDKTLEDAHSASADTRATYEVFKSQMECYKDLPQDINELSEFTTNRKTADLAGFIGFDKEKNEIFNFGKYKGQKVEDILEKDAGYFGWLQKADFPLYTKKVFTSLKLRKLENK